MIQLTFLRNSAKFREHVQALADAPIRTFVRPNSRVRDDAAKGKTREIMPQSNLN